MNIIIANDYATVNGGAAQVAVVSARALAEAGYNIYFVFAAGTPAQELIHENITLVDLEQYDLLNNPSKVNASIIGIWNNDVASKTKKLLAQFSPENTIIHIHTWVKSLSNSFLHAVIESKFPHVITLHDYFSVCPNGGFYNFQSKNICTLKPMSYQCLKSNCDLRSYSQKLWRFTRQAVTYRLGVPRKVSNYIYVSEFSKKILSPYFSDTSTLWNVPNPIDVKKLSRATPDLFEHFSFIGRLSNEKGVKLFAQAAVNSGSKARFVGSGEMEASLKEINPSAEFTGWASRDDVTQYIQQSRAIVVPSLLYETQGMVVAESAALGVPCIVADTCAGRDFVEDGVTGLWFKGSDKKSLTDAIKRLSDNPKLAKELGNNAYSKYWKQPPNIDSHTKTLTACYRAIISGSAEISNIN